MAKIKLNLAIMCAMCRASDFFIFFDGPKHIKLATVDIWEVYFTYTRMHICILTADYTVKSALRGNSKKKNNYRLKQGKSIAECSKGSILHSFRPSLSYHLLLRFFKIKSF